MRSLRVPRRRERGGGSRRRRRHTGRTRAPWRAAPGDHRSGATRTSRVGRKPLNHGERHRESVGDNPGGRARTPEPGLCLAFLREVARNPTEDTVPETGEGEDERGRSSNALLIKEATSGSKAENRARTNCACARKGHRFLLPPPLPPQEREGARTRMRGSRRETLAGEPSPL